MPLSWHRKQPVPSTAITATSWEGPPIIGNAMKCNNKPRILIGWTHQNDTPEALLEDQLYASVHVRGDREFLLIWSAPCNRSENPGEVVFCGLVNFTMIRMFHPLWATAGPDDSLPRDMACGKYKDKANLRRIYKDFIKTIEINGEFPYRDMETEVATINQEDESDQSLFVAQGDPHGTDSDRGPGNSGTRNGQGRGKRSTGSKPRKGRAAKNKAPLLTPVLMTNQTLSLRELAAADDGLSVKSDSRDGSPTPSSHNYHRSRPRGSCRNPIDLINYEELAAHVAQQEDAFASAPQNTVLDLTMADARLAGEEEVTEADLTAWVQEKRGVGVPRRGLFGGVRQGESHVAVEVGDGEGKARAQGVQGKAGRAPFVIEIEDEEGQERKAIKSDEDGDVAMLGVGVGCSKEDAIVLDD